MVVDYHIQNDNVFNGVNWTHLNDICSQLQLLIKRYKFDYIKYKNQTKKLYFGLNLLKLIRLL